MISLTTADLGLLAVSLGAGLLLHYQFFERIRNRRLTEES